MKVISLALILLSVSSFWPTKADFLLRECHEEAQNHCGDAVDRIKCVVDAKFSDKCRTFIDSHAPCLSSFVKLCHDKTTPLESFQCLVEKRASATDECQKHIDASPMVQCREVVNKLCPEAKTIEDSFKCIKTVELDAESPCLQSMMEFGKHWRMMSMLLGSQHEEHDYHDGDHSHHYHHHPEEPMPHHPYHHPPKEPMPHGEPEPAPVEEPMHHHGPYRHARQVCAGDVEEFCMDSDLPPPVCLAKHRDEISEACFEIMESSVPFRCGDFVETICADEIAIGPAEVHQCLLDNIEDLDEGCREAVEQVDVASEPGHGHHHRWHGHGKHRHHHPIVAFVIASLALVGIVGLVSYFRRRRRAETVQYRPFV